MNKVLTEMSLQAGGSHYPGINTHLQEAFAKMIVEKCAELASQPSSYPHDSYADMIRVHFELTTNQD
jgi:hypothetical protein